MAAFVLNQDWARQALAADGHWIFTALCHVFPKMVNMCYYVFFCGVRWFNEFPDLFDLCGCFLHFLPFHSFCFYISKSYFFLLLRVSLIVYNTFWRKSIYVVWWWVLGASEWRFRSKIFGVSVAYNFFSNGGTITSMEDCIVYTRLLYVSSTVSAYSQSFVQLCCKIWVGNSFSFLVVKCC